MKISTIGFTKKPARRFFDLLMQSDARRVVDVRLNNGSQLAGFAKKDDLAYFLGELCEMEYVHLPDPGSDEGVAGRLQKKGVAIGQLTRTDSSRLCASGELRRRFRKRLSPTDVCCAARISRTVAIGGSWPSTCNSIGATWKSCISDRKRVESATCINPRRKRSSQRSWTVS